MAEVACGGCEAICKSTCIGICAGSCSGSSEAKGNIVGLRGISIPTVSKIKLKGNDKYIDTNKR